VLAETVQLDGRLIALFIAIFLVVCAAIAFVVIGGAVAAYRAGKGSRTAQVLWPFAVALEGLAVLAYRNSSKWGVAAVAVIALQIALFFIGRAQ
jgi:hypothetical protein